MKFETTYKGFKIEFDNERYTAFNKEGDVIKESKTEGDIIKYLEDFLKGKKKVNIPIIRGVSYRDNYSMKLGKITSIVRYEDNKVFEVWINIEGDKRKEYVNNIYADTPENREKMNKIIEIYRKIDTLSKEREEIEKTLTHPEIKIDEEVKNENKEVSL